MCGPDTSTRPRGGALAALCPVPDAPCGISCDLTFLTPGSPTSSRATHLRLESEEGLPSSDIRLIIHKTGELDKPASECGCLSDLDISGVRQHIDGVEQTMLASPVCIGVGGDGVIGRRVSLFISGSHVAQGIIGYNF